MPISLIIAIAIMFLLLCAAVFAAGVTLGKINIHRNIKRNSLRNRASVLVDRVQNTPIPYRLTDKALAELPPPCSCGIQFTKGCDQCGK